MTLFSKAKQLINVLLSVNRKMNTIKILLVFKFLFTDLCFNKTCA
nr:MAG TPA: hypothetical protein [Caudoviricetes sp.]